MAVSLNLDIALHVGAFGVGYLLFRKTRVVRDHEWQRSRAIKAVGGHFKAEDSGVWDKDYAMDTQLSAQAEASMKEQVGVIVGGLKTSTKTEIDTENLAKKFSKMCLQGHAHDVKTFQQSFL